MTYLKPTTCDLLHKLGVKCKTGKSWGEMYGNAGADPWCDHVISEMDERETRFTWIPAYSLPLLITDSEAMKAIFGEEKVDQYGEIIPLFIADDFPDNRSNWQYQAHHLLGDLLSGDYEAAEQLLVEALTERVK